MSAVTQPWLQVKLLVRSIPTRAERTKGRAPGYEDQYGQQVWCEGVFGDTNDYAVGSYLYTDFRQFIRRGRYLCPC